MVELGPLRRPARDCGVCKWEEYTDWCECSLRELLDRGEITESEAYRTIGVEPFLPDEFQLPLGARRQSFDTRLVNVWRRLAYRRRHGHACRHADVTSWCMINEGMRQVRWCRACEHTEFR